MSEEPKMCACGQPLHYTIPEMQRYVEKMVAELGENVTVTVGRTSYAVPRHYIALHGIRASELGSKFPVLN